MKRNGTIALLAVAFAALAFTAPAQDWPEWKGEDPLAEAALTDQWVDSLLTSFDALLETSEVKEDFAKGSRLHFWRLMSRLRKGRLSPAQRGRVFARLIELKQAHPEAAAAIDKQIFNVSYLMIGDVAPNIDGKDLDGVHFDLEDYRGRVVALYFTGHWCGPCRSEYPYQREIIEEMKDQPFDLLAVNSDKTPAEVKASKAEEGLHFRMWFDGGSTKGPIATRWDIIGWPTVYVLDAEGRIRFAGTRHAQMQDAARKLVTELKTKAGGRN